MERSRGCSWVNRFNPFESAAHASTPIVANDRMRRWAGWVETLLLLRLLQLVMVLVMVAACVSVCELSAFVCPCRRTKRRLSTVCMPCSLHQLHPCSSLSCFSSSSIRTTCISINVEWRRSTCSWSLRLRSMYEPCLAAASHARFGVRTGTQGRV